MSAGKPRKEPAPVSGLTLAQLADEHRGLTMGIWRYEQRKEQVEAELTARGVPSAEGERAIVSLQFGDIGLIDIKRLRADLGDLICREYAKPGSDRFWRSVDKDK